MRDRPAIFDDCHWLYQGKPCKVVDVYVQEGAVSALFVNTGVGPDIRAELSDLTYEIKMNG